jgi:hypothetical protein
MNIFVKKIANELSKLIINDLKDTIPNTQNLDDVDIREYGEDIGSEAFNMFKNFMNTARDVLDGNYDATGNPDIIERKKKRAMETNKYFETFYYMAKNYIEPMMSIRGMESMASDYMLDKYAEKIMETICIVVSRKLFGNTISPKIVEVAKTVLNNSYDERNENGHEAVITSLFSPF